MGNRAARECATEPSLANNGAWREVPQNSAPLCPAARL